MFQSPRRHYIELVVHVNERAGLHGLVRGFGENQCKSIDNGFELDQVRHGVWPRDFSFSSSVNVENLSL